MVFYNCSGV
jgi:hypothetical protein